MKTKEQQEMIDWFQNLLEAHIEISYEQLFKFNRDKDQIQMNFVKGRIYQLHSLMHTINEPNPQH